MQNEAIGSFFVLSHDSVKKELKELLDIQNLDIPEKTKQTLLAAWLANQGEEWIFEAYQHVAGIRTYMLAQQLKLILAKGSNWYPIEREMKQVFAIAR
ncbi:hypothetical protein BGP_5843 [Beggiatoa sp. PS]|nr:hypothetical protein BGP_5843 [Beggiatoa sp. PS]